MNSAAKNWIRMKVICNAGMGDIVVIVSILTHFKTFKFSLCPNLTLCDIYHRGQGKVFAHDLIEYLCSGSNVTPEYDTELGSKASQFKSYDMLIDLAKEHGLEIQYPSSFLVSKFLRMENFANKVVITTKSRGCTAQKIHQILPQITPYLQTLASNVIIMGVQKCPEGCEYSKPGNEQFSLYQQLKSALPEAVDMTNLALDGFDFNLQDFIRDLRIMISARKVLTLGHGGNTVMGQFNDNCISYVTNRAYRRYEQILYGDKLVHTVKEFMKSFREWKLV
jgi:hypothetical protein